MDISISSNFERYLLYLADGDTATLKQWMDIFEKTGEVAIGTKDILKKARADFASYASSKEEIVKCMRETYDAEKYLLCPHTATAAIAVKKLKLKADTTVILATAHPAKFEEAISLALTDGRQVPERPKELNALYSQKTNTNHLPKDLKKVQSFILSKLNHSLSLFRPSNYVFGVGVVAATLIAAFGIQRNGGANFLKNFKFIKF
jgi:threonine synthase